MLIIPELVSIFLGHKIREISAQQKLLYKSNAEDIKKYQIAKLNKLVNHFRSYDFYQEQLLKNGGLNGDLKSLEDIRRLPVMTKEIIMKNLFRIASGSHAYIQDSTSGSTGLNFKFYLTKDVLERRRASLITCYDWMGVDFFGDKNITIWGQHIGDSLKTRLVQFLKVFIKNGRILQAYGLNEEKCIEFLKYINKFCPKLIVSYPSYAYDLAVTGEKYKISPAESVHAIVLSGEMVYGHHIEMVSRYFGCKVYNRYGSREFGLIAHQGSEGEGMHVLPSEFYVESNEKRELLITDLNNFATPFIRYAIGDMGQVQSTKHEEGCFQTITKMLGRSHDIISTKSGKQIPGQFWTTLSRSIPGIKQFQVVQVDNENIEFRIVADESYCESNENKLFNQVCDLAGNEIKIKILKIDRIEPTKAGKQKYVIRMEQQPQ